MRFCPLTLYYMPAGGPRQSPGPLSAARAQEKNSGAHRNTGKTEKREKKEASRKERERRIAVPENPQSFGEEDVQSAGAERSGVLRVEESRGEKESADSGRKRRYTNHTEGI